MMSLKKINWLRNYIIIWFALVWLQFVLQFDEGAIAWKYNDLQKFIKQFQILPKKKKNSKIQILKLLKYQKILNNQMIHCLGIIEIK